MKKSGAPRRPISILAGQIEIPAMTTVSQRDAHVDRVCMLLDRELGDMAADLVVLPELATLDYSRESFRHLVDLAETPDGRSGKRFAEIAARHDTTVVFGLPRITESGYRICQAVVMPDGQISHYDKIHTAQFGASMEKEFFQRGERIFLFELGGMRIAPIICYDIRIPELSRTLVVEHGVDLILHCGAYARDESFPSWHAFVVTRAMENQIYMLSLNRAGADFGASMFCPPWVDEDVTPVDFPEVAETFLRLSVDPAVIDETRTRYSFLADRLDAYTA